MNKISDPPNIPDIKDQAWEKWMDQLRQTLLSVGIVLPPNPYGSTISNQSWIEYAVLVFNAVGSVSPPPNGVSLESDIWNRWYSEVANAINS